MIFPGRAFPFTRCIHICDHLKTASCRAIHATAAKMTVQRITMFKVANEADIPAFAEQYSTLEKSQQKVCLFARDHGTEEAQRLIHR